VRQRRPRFDDHQQQVISYRSCGAVAFLVALKSRDAESPFFQAFWRVSAGLSIRRLGFEVRRARWIYLEKQI
jgi:hypothetical protein